MAVNGVLITEFNEIGLYSANNLFNEKIIDHVIFLNKRNLFKKYPDSLARKYFSDKKLKIIDSN